MLITGDQQLLKQINRMVLVRKLCHQPELSRADLAAEVGLTKSTVSLLVKELVDEGWFTESELVTTGGLGRRPTPLNIDTRRLALLGAELGIDEARVVVTDLLGNVIESVSVPYENGKDAASCLALTAKSIIKLTRRASSKGRAALGLGVGMHGGVDETLGVLHFAPNLGWRNVDAAGILKKHFAGTILEGLPLFVQNEADVAALAEFEFTQQHKADPLIYLSIGHGVGAGIIVRDSLLTGYRGFAGEVGHTILQANGPRCSCGRRGCAEALLGFGAMLGESGSSASPARSEALVAFFDNVANGNAEAIQIVAAAGVHLGTLLNNLWVSFDPMRMVVGGPAIALGDILLSPALSALNTFSQEAGLPAPTIELSKYGVDAVAIGGAALVRYRLTRPYTTPMPNTASQG